MTEQEMRLIQSTLVRLNGFEIYTMPLIEKGYLLTIKDKPTLPLIYVKAGLPESERQAVIDTLILRYKEGVIQ